MATAFGSEMALPSNWRFNADANNTGHGFAIVMASVGALRPSAPVNLGYKGFPICQANASPINCLWQLIFEIQPFTCSQR
jgi:hypothetical protein